MSSLPRDENRVPVAGGVSTADETTPIAFRVDPTTKRLITNAITSAQSTFDTGSNLDVDTTAEQLTTTSTPAQLGVLITTPVLNTAVVYIGNSDVTAGTTDATDGIPVNAGESLFLEIDDANKVYAIGGAANQKVFFAVI